MKIFDCFTFFNELEVLEIRLNELDKYVDYFVLVESKKTFTFKEKILYYDQNKHLFEKFRHKIIHVPMDFGGRGEWGNEFAQRDSIRQGLVNADPDDIVILSDVDEIPNLKGYNFDSLKYRIAGFPMQYYYYFLNNKMNLTQTIIKAFRVSHLYDNSPQAMRGKEPHIFGKLGWHFSYMGGVNSIRRKLDAFAHQDMNLPEYNNDTHLHARLERNEDLFNRQYSFEVVPVDNTFPEYLVNNQDKFKHMIK